MLTFPSMQVPKGYNIWLVLFLLALYDMICEMSGNFPLKNHEWEWKIIHCRVSSPIQIYEFEGADDASAPNHPASRPPKETFIIDCEQWLKSSMHPTSHEHVLANWTNN